MVQVHLVKAFTQDPREGNPAGVVFDELSEKQMSDLAASLDFPATAFLHKQTSRTYGIRFFSPTQESGLCVHALLAAAQIVIPDSSTEAYQFQARKYNLDVVRSEAGALMVELPDAEFGNVVEDVDSVTSAIDVSPDALIANPIQIVSTGKPKIIIPFKTLSSLERMEPNLDLVETLCRSNSAEGFFAYTSETHDPDNHFYARHFNPLTLRVEDPVCGVGSGALVAYLLQNKLSSRTSFTVEMGFTTNTPGVVHVNAYQKIQVGGFATKFGEEAMEVESVASY